tara:strand:- start:118 stop:402 length:285 start_codon:yes stop_codon:yes gene_type:complete
MPFALVPDGFKLQKVTKLQKEAIDKYNSSKNIEAFFEGPASAELVKAVAIVVTPIVLAALAKQGIEGLPSADSIIDKALEAVNIDLSALGNFNL